MNQGLEKLCRRLARDRDIELSDNGEGSLSGAYNGLIIGIFPLESDAELFGMEREGESSVVLVYGQNDKLAEIQLQSGCLRDYLTLLSRARQAFPQLARDRFEFYLDAEPGRYMEQFPGTNILDVFWVVNAFYPPMVSSNK